MRKERQSLLDSMVICCIFKAKGHAKFNFVFSTRLYYKNMNSYQNGRCKLITFICTHRTLHDSDATKLKSTIRSN